MPVWFDDTKQRGVSSDHYSQFPKKLSLQPCFPLNTLLSVLRDLRSSSSSCFITTSRAPRCRTSQMCFFICVDWLSDAPIFYPSFCLCSASAEYRGLAVLLLFTADAPCPGLHPHIASDVIPLGKGASPDGPPPSWLMDNRLSLCLSLLVVLEAFVQSLFYQCIFKDLVPVLYNGRSQSETVKLYDYN